MSIDKYEQYKLAEQYFSEAESIYRQLDGQSGLNFQPNLAYCLSMLSHLRFIWGQFNQSAQGHIESIEIFNGLDNGESVANCHYVSVALENVSRLIGYLVPLRRMELAEQLFSEFSICFAKYAKLMNKDNYGTMGYCISYLAYRCYNMHQYDNAAPKLAMAAELFKLYPWKDIYVYDYDYVGYHIIHSSRDLACGLFKLSKCYFKQGMIEQSDAAFLEAYSIDDYLCRSWLRKGKEFSRHIERLLNPSAQEEEKTSNSFLAKNEYAQGRYKKCITLVDNELKNNFDWPEGFDLKGMSMLALGRTKAALRVWQEMVQIFPDYLNDGSSILDDALREKGLLDKID